MTPRETQAGARLVALFEREGYARVEPPVLQPADVFLDLSGEDMRRRMFVTQDAAGTELCLRPEYTIPVCRHHLEAHGRIPASYAYCGPVFRLRSGESGEFAQAGIESIGRHDRAATDAEILALALDGLAALGVGDVDVRLGDMGLLEAVVDALGVTGVTRGRLMRAIVSGHGPEHLDGSAEAGADDDHAGLLAAIAGQDPQAARVFVEDVLAIAGISTVGGRTAGEIAERFLARAARRSGGISGDARAVLARYLAIAGDPDACIAQVRTLAREAGLDLGPVLGAFEERLGYLAARGLDVARFRFAADFARNLDYYTGFIFEITAPETPPGKPLVGGGRYDRLLSHLGSAEAVPAVGCAFWLDRLASRGDAA